jgi:hypothetical protein
LEGTQDLAAARTASPEFFQKLNGFRRGHLRFMIYEL